MDDTLRQIAVHWLENKTIKEIASLANLTQHQVRCRLDQIRRRALYVVFNLPKIYGYDEPLIEYDGENIDYPTAVEVWLKYEIAIERYKEAIIKGEWELKLKKRKLMKKIDEVW